MRLLFASLIAALVLTFSAPAAGAQILWGAWVDGDAYGPTYDDPPWDMAAQDLFEQHAGKRASIIHYGQFWRENGVSQPFYPNPANAVIARGAVPLLDWNPWDSAAGGATNQPAFRLSRIAAGYHDAYIRSWAQGVAAWGHRILVRPMHEMNGNWYPWSERTNGNRAGDYVKAWKRILRVADQAGASNIEWVWSPNVIYSGSIPLTGLYPGEAWTEWVAMDGYNWGGSQWTDSGDVLYPTYAALRQLAPSRPVMIAETGSAEAGGDKAQWIQWLFEDIEAGYYDALGALVWFNWDADGHPWRIESSPAAQSAFAAGIASPRFVEP